MERVCLAALGLWLLHMHGNAETAFSAEQARHAEQLRAWGLNVLSFDYRGFGHSPGVASEQHLYEDADSAYQALIRRAPHTLSYGGTRSARRPRSNWPPAVRRRRWSYLGPLPRFPMWRR